jgi:hypothetical protein
VLLASAPGDQIKLRAFLHPFGDNRQPEMVRELHNRR